MNTIFPRTEVPSLTLPTVDSDLFELNATLKDTENFLVILFYRGYHCPVCKSQLRDFNKHYKDFTEKGVKVIAISSDTEQRANKAKEDWRIDQLPIAYNLDLEAARKWGLFVSKKKEDSEEPDFFSEPGLFVVQPNKKLYASVIQTMPFTRPSAKAVLKGIEFVLDKNYPARGEVTQVMAMS